MKGFEHPELMNWDGPLSSSSYNPQSHKDVPSTSPFKSTSSTNPTLSSAYPSSISSQDANDSGEDSDCYIINVSSSIDDLPGKKRGSTRASIKRASSIETLSPAHMPHLFQPSNHDMLFPLIQHTSTHDTSAALKPCYRTMASLKLSRLPVINAEIRTPDPRCIVPNAVQTGQSAGNGFAINAS
ncbi:hypothetical protein C8R48DRAFT_772102 [Suillus tomentosus]|nr:hypothetical protein C8R48DRAFT_772102 [Suillus tomentosus]